MKINPTFGAANQVVTHAWIPRNRFYDLLQVTAVVFVVTQSFQFAAGVFAVLWSLFFAAYVRDPQYLALLWRSFRRKPILCPVRLAKSDIRRIQHA